jgi:small subunit ribosomal protein S11
MAYKKKAKKAKLNTDTVTIYVKSSFNNTLVSITTANGDVILRGSAGASGFKGTRKSTPYAATEVASALARDLHAKGVKFAEVNMQGPGAGRDSVVRAFQASGIAITSIRDITPLAHNGCRPAKRARN